MNDNVVTADERREADAQSSAGALVEYTETERGLAEFRHKYEKVVFDVTTTAGEKQAREARRELVGLRTSLDKLRKQLNQDDQARINLRNEKAKEITTQIEALEEPIDAQIKAQEEEAERKREAKRQAEAAARAAVEAELSAIRNLPVAYVTADAATLRERIEELTANTLEHFDEVYLPTAQQAKDTALDALGRLLEQRDAADAEAERNRLEREALTAARAEHEREQAAADARRAEQEEADRIAREQRESVDRAIAAIAGIPNLAAAEGSEQIEQRREALVNIELLSGAFADRVAEAEAARYVALQALDVLLAAARQREADAAENTRVAAEQADRQRALDEQEAAQRREAEEAEQARQAQLQREEADRREAARIEREQEQEAQRRRWSERQIQGGHLMTEAELDALVSLLMASDGVGGFSEAQRLALTDWANAESVLHGFTDWIDALHGLAHAPVAA